MSSKLDEMRIQFRERLTVRPVPQNRINVLKVESNFTNRLSDSKIGSKGTNDSRNLNFMANKNVPQIGGNYNKTSLNPMKVIDSRNAKPISRLSMDSKNSSLKPMESYYKESTRYTPITAKSSPKLSKNVANNTNQEFKPKIGFIRELEKRKERQPMVSQSTRLGVSLAKDRANSEGTPCRFCGRFFAISDRLVKHESVCGSVISKSREKFDSIKQRFKGKPNEYLQSYENSLNDSEQEEKKRQSNWRQKHEYCIASIRAAKGDNSTGPTTAQITAALQEPCHYCKRRFNDDALQRHLPICAKLYHKKVMNYKPYHH